MAIAVPQLKPSWFGPFLGDWCLLPDSLIAWLVASLIISRVVSLIVLVLLRTSI